MHQNDNEAARVVNLAGFVSLCFTLPLDEFTPVVILFIARWSRSPIFSTAVLSITDHLKDSLHLFISLRNDYRRTRFRGGAEEARGSWRHRDKRRSTTREFRETTLCWLRRTDCLIPRFSTRLLPALGARGCVWVVKRANCHYFLTFVIFSITIQFLFFFFVQHTTFYE